MDNINRLIELLRELPGIGPRQAKRFAYFLLNKHTGYTDELSRLIQETRKAVSFCPVCFRLYTETKGGERMCNICRDDSRDKTKLLVVSHDIDFENIEKTKFYNGYYFVLGGTVPILEKNPEQKIRQADLLQKVKEKIAQGLSEIIIALSYNPEGENTLSYLTEILTPVISPSQVKLSTLGRGLSVGTELEYSDSDTLRNALKNRQ